VLKGERIALRPAREEDLPTLYEHILNLENRGEFYPAHIQSLTELRKEFDESGFWKSDAGSLALVGNETDRLVGEIHWFTTVQYMTELEIGYIMYDTAARSRGAMTEAVQMLTRYLFDSKQYNRIRLCIATENAPSRRVAEKSGYKHEATQRGAWWYRGRHYDMEMYALTREDLQAA
jgi:ribosomal-protein-alanine N-acetyltransferase